MVTPLSALKLQKVWKMHLCLYACFVAGIQSVRLPPFRVTAGTTTFSHLSPPRLLHSAFSMTQQSWVMPLNVTCTRLGNSSVRP